MTNMYSLPERDLVGNLPVRSAAAHSLRGTMKVSAWDWLKGQSGRESVVSEQGVSSVMVAVSSDSCDEGEGGV